MDNDYMWGYCDDYEPEMGIWQTFFFMTLLAIVFIILWPIALVLIIYAWLSEKRWNAQMEEESLNDERRHRYYDEMDEEKKTLTEELGELKDIVSGRKQKEKKFIL